MTNEQDALDILAAQARREDAKQAPDPRPEDILPTSLAPTPGTGVSA